MNKQEAIEKIEKGKSNFNAWEDLVRNRALEDALTIVKKIDEPERPVVPQFVADWYEEHKDNFEYSVQCLCVQGCKPVRQIDIWFDNDDNKPIVTLVKMNLFGYEVKKEKLYTVEIPNPNIAGGKIVLLRQDTTGKLILNMLHNSINMTTYLYLTEQEIKQDFEWAWHFAKEVEE